MSKAQTQVLIVWREFLAGVKRRARLLEAVRAAAAEPLCPPGALKEMLVELRQLTIKVVEDALEIEYRSQFGDSRPPVRGGASVQLPSIDKFQTLEKKEDILILAAMVTDADALFLLKNVSSLLPADFPTTRNPLMLGRTIDDLAALPVPAPEPGNSEQELRALEFMRYKRASKALLKAEAQVMNKMPILLEDVERVWLLKDQNSSINALVRVAVTLLAGDNHEGSGAPPQLSLLQGAPLDTEPAAFLRDLNRCRGGVRLPADVHAAARQALYACDMRGIHDPSVEYIAEWVGVVVGTTIVVRQGDQSTHHSHSKSFSSGQGQGGRGRSRGSPEEPSAATVDDMHMHGSGGRGGGGGGSSPDGPSPMKSRTHGSVSAAGGGSGADRLSSTTGAGAGPPAPIQKSKAKAKMMAERADILMASAVGAAKKQDSKRRAEIARLKGGSAAAAGPEQGELNAIRYELIKMQQELLRRKILDPRHYKAASIDSQEVLEQKKQSNPTAGTASSAKKMGEVRSKKAGTSRMAQNVPLAVQSVDWAQHHGSIEIAIEPLSDMIVVRYRESPLDGVDGGGSLGSAGGASASASAYEGDPLTMRVSKLSLHRLTGRQVDALLEATKEVRRVDLLPLFEKFMEGMAEYDSSLQRANSTLTAQAHGSVVSPDLVLDIDRELCAQEITSGGVAMAVGVSRDSECSGLLVTCTPHPGALRVAEHTRYDTGPVTLFLHDRELQVLLINQRGLYSLAQTKWSCMVMVAQWLISRLHARRIPVFQGGMVGRPNTAGQELRERAIRDAVRRAEAPAPAPASASRNGSRNGSLDASAAPESSPAKAIRAAAAAQDAADVPPADQELVLVKEEEEEDSVADEGSTEDWGAEAGDGPMLLEVTVDRSVDIAEDVVALWQARNVPSLLCAAYRLSACQDMEMLRVTIAVRMPDQVTGERLFNALADQKNSQLAVEKLAKDKARKKRKKGVRIYTEFDEDEEHDSDEEAAAAPVPELTAEQILSSNATYTELSFSFSLTGTELLVFGSTEILEDMHKTSAMKSKKAFQASKFMRNILGRLFLQFKHHHVHNIYDNNTNVLDKSQWDMTFDRRLFRDVRTISGGVLIVAASVIGSEILFDAQPTEGSIFRQVGSKLCTEEEIRDLVLQEGWPLDTLQPEHRVSLAFRILDTMKVVQSGEVHRLESSSYAECKMLSVIRQGTFNKPDAAMGMVEINEHHTLSDLRTIIQYELDKAVIPRKFVFNYKGAACAQRQEQFRKAWELLPKVFVISLVGAPADEVSELERKEPKKKEGPVPSAGEKKDGKLTQAARSVAALVRLNKKLSPVPVPSMCRVYNDHPPVYLLHSMVECALAPGDVIRFGSAEGSDYVIPMKRSLKRAVLDNRKFDVDPKITGMSDLLLTGNFPKNALRHKKFKILMPSRADFGLEYLPYTDDTKAVVDSKALLNTAFADGLSLGAAAGLSPVKGMPSADVIKQKESNQEGREREAGRADMAGLELGAVADVDLDKRDEENPVEKEKERDMTPYQDVWMWKCVPRGEDRRPVFRRQYDAGLVPYEYKHSSDSKAGLTFFRVFVCWKDLELYCTDSRCPSLSVHVQRVEERDKFSVEYLVDLAYSHMLTWTHSSTAGIDYAKFQKLVTECNIFSDIKKAARLYQMEILFEREVKGPNGVGNKYVTQDGFHNILQDVAIIRFPSTVGEDEDALFDQPSAPPAMPGQAMNRRKGVMQKGNKYMAHESLAAALAAGVGKKEGGGKERSRSKERSGSPTRDHSRSRERPHHRGGGGGGGDDASVNSDDSEVFYGGSRSQSVSQAAGKEAAAAGSVASGDTKTRATGDNSTALGAAVTPSGGSLAKSVDFDEDASVGSGSVITRTSKGSAATREEPAGRGKKKKGGVFQNADPAKRAQDEYMPVLPRLNRTPQEAEHDELVLRRLMNDYVMNMDGWQKVLWETAKSNAMTLEATRFGACVRIQAAARRRLQWHRFWLYKQAMVKLQAVTRRRIGVRFYETIYTLLLEDWVFRARYEGAMRIQASIRRYNVRCAFLKHMKRVKAQEVILMKARRQRFRKMREKEKKGILFKETRRVAGVCLCLVIKRKDQRNYSNNYGIIIEVYLPDSQSTLKFTVEEAELRAYMQGVLQAEACNIADLMDRRNLQRVVASRLMLRPSDVKAVPHKVSMSRQALGQRGSKKLVKGVKCSNEFFVCTVFSSGASVDVSCYHRLSCTVFKCSISQKAVHDWVMSVYGPRKEAAESEVEKSLRRMRRAQLEAAQAETEGRADYTPPPPDEEEKVVVKDLCGPGGGTEILPALLKPGNEKDLYFWLVQRIAVDKRHGQFKVIFQCQMEKSKKSTSIIKIQALWRRAIVRSWILHKLDSYLVKIQTSLYEEHAYYVNRNSGESSWEKSLLLKGWDLPTQPQYRWVQLWYSYESPLFVNPLTGKYTHLSVNRAAQIIQATARAWFLRPFLLPPDNLAKCVEFEKTSKARYDKAKEKLAGMINFALLSFAVKRDERVARQLLTQAMGLADTNPVVSRLSGIFSLATCEAPLQASRDRAAALFRDAHIRDAERKKFEAARDIFKFACLRKPKDAHTILNYGLVEYYIFDNVQLSEVLLRRAVSLLPFDERIFENWKHMRDFFPEKRMLYRPKNQIEKLKQSGVSQTGKKKVVHDREVIEDFAWAGWLFAKSGATSLNPKISKEYWYNPATGEETFDIPHWEAQWDTRLHRSHYEGTTAGIEHYFDPLTACYFQRHVLSETYS
jgi:hypothetical protein